MIIALLASGSFVLAIAILVVILLKKQPARRKKEDKADRIMEEIKNSMKIFEYPKVEEPEYKELKFNKDDVIDKTVDIFDGAVKKDAKQSSKNKAKKTPAKKTKKRSK